MDISIIICTHNRAKDLAAMLNSLRQVHVPDGALVEAVVIENGVRDNTENVVRSFRQNRIIARYLYEPLKSKSRALNRGLTEANGEILVFTDDDVRFYPDWLDIIYRIIVHDKGFAVAGGVRIPSHLLRPWMTRYHRTWLACSEYLSRESPDEMAGANMTCHRAVVQKVPRFDVELGGGGLGNCEDTLFSWQVRAAGFKIWSGLNSSIEHHFDPSKLSHRQWIKSAEAAGRSRAYLMYHWLHEDIKFPLVRLYYYLGKLRIRRVLTPRIAPDAEGIPPWELSYLLDMAKCAQFMIERRRPRNYAKMGLIKLNGER